MRIETILNALGDRTRLRIMKLLQHLEFAVGELAQMLGQSQPRVSRHVAILCDAGLIERRREGGWIFLRNTVSLESARPIAACVARLLAAAEDEDEEFAARCAEDRRHLAAIRATRERAATEFFAGQAEKWDRLRALLSPAREVEAALLKALEGRELGNLLDIGTGTGRIAELLAERADHIVGLDRSPEMLRVARARLQTLPVEHWELMHGDFNALPFAAGIFDTIVLHQVLHYAQNPAHVLQEAARVAREEARIVVVDLAAHEREELRKHHAHVRLGFTDEQLLSFLSECGFSASLPLALPGKGLTTKVWIAARGQPATRSKKSAKTRGIS